jgi:hypothetical protein
MSSLDYAFVLLERLHASLQVGEVLNAIQEALISLVGSEEFALFVRDDESGRFEPLWAIGVRAAALQPFAAGEGVLGKAAEDERISYGVPVATVPLLSGRHPGAVAVVAITGLLPQKSGLTAQDLTLLELLSRHGGLALEAAICAQAAPVPICFVEELRRQTRPSVVDATFLRGGRS